MTITPQQRKINYARRRADHSRRVRYRRVREATEALGGCCSNCGSTSKLYFAAKNVNEQSRLAKVATHREEIFQTEVERNILLCSPCLWERYMASNRRRRFKHGTNYSYDAKKCRCEICLEHHEVRKAQRRERERLARAGSSTG